ncbi:hydrophobin-315, partial [Fomitiporia mediterranea MF3/22]|uniref:hydrophobin-315 n=1 Tax=Fomitiporia mediterranea (strain MF3/22) TaxID=694068 RepID=UPI00044092BF
PASQCNTGPIQCCNSVTSPDDPAASTLLGLLGVVVQGVDVLVGITCSPISVIGVGGNSCNAQPVCCENNSFNGLIAIGCVPVNINL